MGAGRYVFSSAVEAIFKGLGEEMTPALGAHLKAHGLDVNRLPAVLPIEDWAPLLRRIATFVWPTETEDAALRLLARRLLEGWKTTSVGTVAAPLILTLGPLRAFQRFDRLVSSADNFTKATVEVVRDKELLISLNELQGLPSYWVGLLEGGLALMGGEGTVTIHRVDPPGATFRVTWV